MSNYLVVNWWWRRFFPYIIIKVVTIFLPRPHFLSRCSSWPLYHIYCTKGFLVALTSSLLTPYSTSEQDLFRIVLPGQKNTCLRRRLGYSKNKVTYANLVLGFELSETLGLDCVFSADALYIWPLCSFCTRGFCIVDLNHLDFSNICKRLLLKIKH